jgi:nitroreductase
MHKGGKTLSVLEVIRERRSIRRFAETPIPNDILGDIIEAVRWAPSWANTQCWELIVVKERSIRERLQDMMGTNNPATAAIVDAPMVLALCAKQKLAGYYKDKATTKFGDWFMFDLGIATQNICLVAHSHGLGTVIGGLFEHDKAKEVVKVPEGYELVVLIPLGYPAVEPSAPKRKEKGDFLHYETFTP